MIVLAGVDAGGSHTEAAISAIGFRSIKRGVAGPGFVGPARIAIAAGEIESALRKAFSKSDFARADILVVGAAGAGDSAYRNQLAAGVGESNLANEVHVVTDAELALECAFDANPGMLLVAGTGSIAVGRDEAGTVHRVGGHGYEFGDEGSGYAIGRSAIRAVFQAAEGRGLDTLLHDLVFSEAAAASLQSFARWTRIVDRRTVADLASVVQMAAQAGDVVAREIVATAAGDLLDHVLAITSLIATRKTTPLALSGGLLGNPTPLRTDFLHRLRRTLPDCDVVEQSIDPVMGALLIARRLHTASSGP